MNMLKRAAIVAVAVASVGLVGTGTASAADTREPLPPAAYSAKLAPTSVVFVKLGTVRADLWEILRDMDVASRKGDKAEAFYPTKDQLFDAVHYVQNQRAYGDCEAQGKVTAEDYSCVSRSFYRG